MAIVLTSKSGVSKVYFTDLPKDIQVRFGYDPQKATAYSAEQSADYAAYQKQQDEAQRQRGRAQQEQGDSSRTQAATNRVQALQHRYTALQQEENATL